MTIMNLPSSLIEPWVITWAQQFDAAKELYQIFWEEVHKHRDVPVVLFSDMPTVQRDAWVEVARASFKATAVVGAQIAMQCGQPFFAEKLRGVEFQDEPS